MNKLTILVLVIFCTGCTSLNSSQCKRWQSEGDFYGSLDSCNQCIAQLGSGNREAVKGCALGMDASRLMGGMTNR